LVVGPLVPVESEPAHPVQDGVHRLLGRAGHIRILDAENEFPPLLPGEKPVEQGGAGASHMEVAGGAGGKTKSYFGHDILLHMMLSITPDSTAATSLVIIFLDGPFLSGNTVLPGYPRPQVDQSAPLGAEGTKGVILPGGLLAARGARYFCDIRIGHGEWKTPGAVAYPGLVVVSGQVYGGILPLINRASQRVNAPTALAGILVDFATTVSRR